MELPSQTIELLRAEAYAVLCRESLIESLAQLNREKEKLMETRPPFGFLGTKNMRETFESSVGKANNDEQSLKNRLQQVANIEEWLHASIHASLDQYLTSVSPDYWLWREVETAIDVWENAASGLPEKAVAFARDARAAANAVNAQIQADPTSQRRARENRLSAIATLRATAESSKPSTHAVQVAAERVHRLCTGKLEKPIELPVPTFPPVSWVDQLALMDNVTALAELQRAEVDARSLGGDGIRTIMTYGTHAHQACVGAREGYLKGYWDQLRQHALAHYVTERDVDEVINELTQHYVAADLLRRQNELVSNPFENER